uniref:Translocon-associated protein subunit delta n=1 Tax=Riptortus pedestris TaxID=329032 RepID=R4WQX1_RIPPE|nr:translocon-associated protein, delta subunit [Riptortus pedestris]
MAYLFSALVLLVTIAQAYSSQICTNPTVSVSSFTTEDGTVITNVAYVSEFTLKCANGATEVPLYAEVNGKTFPVVHVTKDSYQISWVEELAKSRSGEHTINFFDEEGYANLRKAFRNSEQATAVEPLFTIKLNHPGTYQGPWLNSEFMAAAVAAFVWYMAYTSKSKLLSTKQP